MDNTSSYIRGYEMGVKEGKREALIEFQKENPNKDLPSNETLYKIFKLLYECEKNDRKTSSIYINHYEHLANYITKNWERRINNDTIHRQKRFSGGD